MNGASNYLPGGPVEILIATPRRREEWQRGVVLGSHASPFEYEDFQRIDVRVGDLVFEGCHPDCVRRIEAEAAA